MGLSRMRSRRSIDIIPDIRDVISDDPSSADARLTAVPAVGRTILDRFGDGLANNGVKAVRGIPCSIYSGIPSMGSALAGGERSRSVSGRRLGDDEGRMQRRASADRAEGAGLTVPPPLNTRSQLFRRNVIGDLIGREL